MRRARAGGWFAGPGAAPSSEDPSSHVYLSYSDLMTALVLLFALLLVAVLRVYGAQVQKLHEAIEAQKRLAESIDAAITASGLREDMAIDADTGTLTFKKNVLFEENSTELSDEGKALLDRVAGLIAGALDRPELTRHLRRIVIEGHTNDNGEYDYNLDLSQRRAFAVMAYILTTEPARDRLPLFQKILTAQGRSFADLLCRDETAPGGRRPCRTDDPPEAVDKEASRRIEIKLEVDSRAALKDSFPELDGLHVSLHP